jgi:MarR family transcriptional regulator, organic hydroperoxide resistance regulator
MINTRENAMEELRSAFIELMGADRRLKARDPHPQQGDLSHSQLRALFKLQGEEQVTAGELAKRADISPASMTAMLDALERAGMVERHRSETDRRQVIVRLTPAGQERLHERKRAWTQYWENCLGDHSDSELEAAARVFHTMAAMLDGIGR